MMLNAYHPTMYEPTLSVLPGESPSLSTEPAVTTLEDERILSILVHPIYTRLMMMMIHLLISTQRIHHQRDSRIVPQRLSDMIVIILMQ